MRISVGTERALGERRVAMVPDVAPRLSAVGHSVSIEAGAGEGAFFADTAYESRDVEVLGDLSKLMAQADVVCRVQCPTVEEVAHIPQGGALVSFMHPHMQLDVVRALTERGISAFSLDLLPRISRAQAMDALSSQSTVTGYRGALLAAERLPKFFPMLMTAAGTVPPAKVLVLGAGVAGLQAIATARRLGASVRAFDVRASAKDDIRSLGASFVELELEAAEGSGGYAAVQSEEYLERQRELIANEVASANAVICTAAVPGRVSPVLITEAMVDAMSTGSVIIDLAAESGGNCQLTIAGTEVVHGGVLVYGAKDLASSLPTHASFLYARNIAEMLTLLSRDGRLHLDFDDEIVSATCVTHGGVVRHEETRLLLEAAQ